jgi:hypothetical protein
VGLRLKSGTDLQQPQNVCDALVPLDIFGVIRIDFKGLFWVDGGIQSSPEFKVHLESFKKRSNSISELMKVKLQKVITEMD